MQTLPRLNIGPLEIDFPVVQAALSGYSDWAMRVIARRLGAPYTLCEVLLDQFVVQVTRGKKADRYLRVTDEEHPVALRFTAEEQVYSGSVVAAGPGGRLTAYYTSVSTDGRQAQSTGSFYPTRIRYER